MESRLRQPNIIKVTIYDPDKSSVNFLAEICHVINLSFEKFFNPTTSLMQPCHNCFLKHPTLIFLNTCNHSNQIQCTAWDNCVNFISVHNMFVIYLKTRNPMAIPKARTHIPISNGGQLQLKENINTGQYKGFTIDGPFLHEERWQMIMMIKMMGILWTHKVTSSQLA